MNLSDNSGATLTKRSSHDMMRQGILTDCKINRKIEKDISEILQYNFN